MKRNSLFFLFLFVLFLTSCDSGQKIKKGETESTDLHEVSIENIKIRDSINGESIFYMLEDVIEVLGENYHDYWYDKEQSLRAATFTDQENEISLTFVYDINSRNFVWIILSE